MTLNSNRATRFSFTFILGLLALALTASCGSGDLPLEQVDPNAAPLNPTFDDVFFIIERECVPCHTDDGDDKDDEDKSSGALRAGGGAEPDLRTCAAILAEVDKIAKEVLEDNSMPPGAWPRLTSREKLIIQRWLQNGATCP